MKASLQTRVVALVGAGVFLAVALLSLLSRSSLLLLDREVVHDHERLAASLARELSRAVGHDMRLLSGASGAPRADLVESLSDIRRYGRLTSAAFVVDAAGMALACEPAYECADLRQEGAAELTREALAAQRPVVGRAVAAAGGRPRIFVLLPFAPLEGRALAAAGLSIDPADRRLTELLEPADVAPTLRVRVRDADGTPFATSRGAEGEVPSYTTVVPVPGMPWLFELSDVGPDPRAPIIAFRQQSIWLAPTLAAVVMLLGWGVARSVRRPLVDLTAAAERIARGELEWTIDTRRAADGGEEVTRLALALERMRQDLRTSITGLEDARQALEARVAERTRELADANARLEDRERLRQELLRKVITAQEDERKRVARELHDETSQTLAALGIGVDLALAACPHTADAAAMRDRLADVRGLVKRMHGELHRMIVNLRPSVLDDLGLAAAIGWFAERQVATAGIAVRCELEELEDLDTRLPSEIETAIFRAVQEALVNITRHAHAETVLIQGSAADGRLLIEIEDDGVGFDPAGIERSHDSLRGIGLLGMRERLEILGGTLEVDSTPGEGTRIVFSVPTETTAATPPEAVR
jgi:signal transduction histidine kinase